MYEAIARRWKFKLGLSDGFEIPAEEAKKHPSEMDYDKIAKECSSDGPGITAATIRLYVEKTSPQIISAGSKDTFLNMCIEELAGEIEARILNKKESIKKTEDDIRYLEDNENEFDNDDGLEDEDGKKKPKKKMPKFKMCPLKDKCKNFKLKQCKDAHYPYELSAIPYDPKNPIPVDLKNIKSQATKDKKEAKEKKEKVEFDMEQKLGQYNQVKIENLKTYTKV